MSRLGGKPVLIVSPERRNNSFRLPNILYLYKDYLITLQSFMNHLCCPMVQVSMCVCVHMLGAWAGGMFPSVLSIPWQRQVCDCPLLLADCALDQACSFLTVSTAGSEVSCDFYAWTSDNIACTPSGQVSHGSRMAFPPRVCSVRHTLIELTPS